MADLQSDIARIAAQRGRDANYYTDRPAPPVSPQMVMVIVNPGADVAADFDAYDDLPEESRRFLQDTPFPFNAIAYASALRETRSEGRLIATLAAYMPQLVRLWVNRHYDRGHPSLRRLP